MGPFVGILRNKMNEEERLKASIDQTEHFLSCYFVNWRLAKILINEKVLNSKYEFLDEIAEEVVLKPTPKESLIANELTNALQFDILSNAIQYIEDLFALLRAGQKKEFFIRDIITYRAGKVTKLIEQEHSQKRLCELFLIPEPFEFDEGEIKDVMLDGLDRLQKRINWLRKFYLDNSFHYTQYKHGLTIALKPFGDRTPEQIKNDKVKSQNKPFLVALDNLSVKRKKFDDYMMLPNMTKNVIRHVGELHKEDNLLRFVVSPPESTMENFKKCAYIVKECMHLFINNLTNPWREKDFLRIQLPADEEGQVYQFDFPVIDEK